MVKYVKFQAGRTNMQDTDVVEACKELVCVCVSDIPTSQGFYEGDVFLDTQFRSPPWTRFPDHLRLQWNLS